MNDTKGQGNKKEKKTQIIHSTMTSPQNRLYSLKANLCARRSGFPYVRNLHLNIRGSVDVDADYQ
jgi:hypothetical protein